MTVPVPQSSTPAQRVADLVHLLDVEELDADLYRGARRLEGRGRVFGGQVIGQALTAAGRSVEGGRVAHSLHAYFMRPGDETLPIVYRVERDFEGKSFATRRVIALQRGQPILNLAASFQVPEGGLAHQEPMPQVAPPEALVDEAELVRREREAAGLEPDAWFSRPRAIETRPVAPRSMLNPTPQPARMAIWFRTVAPVEGGPDVHRALLAWASDMALLSNSMLPHGVIWNTPGMQSASLDHALWLHETPQVDDWLLYATDSPWAGHARGLNRGSIFSRDGRLIASVAQEGLIRMRAPQA